MFSICASLFISGIIVGSGPCMATCGPILVGFIAATNRSALSGLWSWFVFSFGRIVVYMLLGIMSGFIGSEVIHRFYWLIPSYIIWLLGGVFITLLGILILLGSDNHIAICCRLNKSLIQENTKALLILGLIVGLFPCLPLIGVLSYVAMISTSTMDAFLMTAAFSMGTLVSPLFFLGMITGAMPKLKVFQEKQRLMIFQKAGGVALLVLGVHIIVRNLLGYLKI